MDGLVDSPLPNPFPLADHVRVVLADVMGSQQPFHAGPATSRSDGLAMVATRVRQGEYLVGLYNNGLEQQNFELSSNLGPILSATETSLADSWMNASNTQGYTATHTPPGVDLGHSSATTIAGLDFRVFNVRVDESNTELIDAAHAAPPSLPHPTPTLSLPVSPSRSVQEHLLLRPTFTQHFSSVVVDWRYIERTDVEVLAKEGAWLARQSIRVIVDVSSGINLYPDLRLCNNSARQYTQSLQRIEAVIAKCGTKVNASTATARTGIYSADVIFSLHRAPENYYTMAQCMPDFAHAAKRLSTFADSMGITLHLRAGTDNKPPSTLVQAEAFLVLAGKPHNLKIAASTAMLTEQSVLPGSINVHLVGVWMASAPIYDPYGSSSSASRPPLLTNHGSLTTMSFAERTQTAAVLKLGPHLPVVLDVALSAHDGTDATGLDEEWQEVKVLEALLL